MMQAVPLQRNIVERLEALQEFDDQGHVEANLRRFRRVVERLEGGVISNVQAGLMVGEALERLAEGDNRHMISSFASLHGDRHDSRGWPSQFPLGDPDYGTSVPAHSTGRYGQGRRRRRRFRRFFHRLLPCIVRPPAEPSQHLLSSTPADSFGVGNHGHLQIGTPRSPPAPYLGSLPPALLQLTPASPDSLGATQPQAALEPPAFLLSAYVDTSALPSEFLCPIMREPMTDPVVALDGHTYERSAILRWFEQGSQTSPKTGSPMQQLLIPNHALRAQIMTENDRLAAAAGS